MLKMSVTKSMGRLVAVLLAGLAMAPVVRADDLADRVKQLEAKLAASMQTIEKLSARVSELERTGPPPAQPLAAASAPAMLAAASAPSASAAASAPSASAAASVPSAEAQAKALAALQASVHQISEGLGRRDPEAGVPLHGFADVGAGRSSAEDPNRARGFNAGSLDIYLTPQLGNVKALFELVVEHFPTGETDFDAERLQIGYTVSDSLTLWAGRFHNPIGLWNTLYHHGAYLQTSIARPGFINFEDRGGVIPTHTAGVWGTGRVLTEAGRVTYDLYGGNGPTIRDRTLDINTFTDDTNNKLVGFNVGLKPNGALSGWTFGLHGYGADVNAVSSTNTILSTTSVRLGGAYFAYDSDSWAALGEYYYQRDRDLATSLTTSNNLWFVQASRSFGAFVPYARYERAALDPSDVYFRSLLYGRSYRRALVGLRYDLGPRAAIKTEFADTQGSASQQIDETGATVPSPAVRYRGLAIEYSIVF